MSSRRSLVFMGTAPFAVPSLRSLAVAGYRVSAVVSQPDRPRGRGMQLQPSATKQAALDLGIPVLQPEKASQPEFVQHLVSLAPDLIVVVAYGQILRPSVLEIPPLGCINVHGSLLPELRGAAPVQWAILRGLPQTGVTTMFMDAGMDTGDLLLTATLPIRLEDTAGSLAERMAPVGAELLVRTLRALEEGGLPRKPQDSARATIAPMLHREDGAIAWNEPAVAIRNRIHGCNPSPGAFAFREAERLKLWRAEVVSCASDSPPGTVLDAERLIIAGGSDAVMVIELQPENRSRMIASEYRRGYHVLAGERWRDGTEDPS